MGIWIDGVVETRDRWTDMGVNRGKERDREEEEVSEVWERKININKEITYGCASVIGQFGHCHPAGQRLGAWGK